MKPFQEWSMLQKVSAVLSVVAAMATFVANVNALDDYLPATHAWSKSLISMARAEDALSLSGIAAKLSDISEGLLEQKIIAFDSDLRTLNTQLDQVKLRLVDAPHDDLLLGIQSKLVKELDSINSQRKTAVCEKFHDQFGNAAICP